MDSWFINMIRERCERVIKLARQRQSMADDDDECIAEPSRLLSFGSPAATPHIPTPHRPLYHHHWGSVEKFAKLKATIRRKPILRHTKSKKQSSDRRCMWAAKGGGVAAYDSQ